MNRRPLARCATLAAAVSAVLLIVGGGAQADPPDGWAPGPDGFEFDYGRVLYTQHGWIEGRPGNYHVGDVEAEEDDDGVTGFIRDYFCRGDAVPPPPFSTEPADPRCTLKQTVHLDEGDYNPAMAVFDHERNRVGIHLEVDSFDSTSEEPRGTVRIDLTIAGRGEPDVTHEETPTGLTYDEWWHDGVRAWGKVDGITINKRTTVIHQDHSLIGFWLYNWVRTP